MWFRNELSSLAEVSLYFDAAFRSAEVHATAVFYGHNCTVTDFWLLTAETTNVTVSWEVTPCNFFRGSFWSIPSSLLFAIAAQVWFYGQRLATRAIWRTMTVTSCSAVALHIQQSRHLGFRTFVITRFNTSLSAYREWSRRIEKRQRGGRVGFPHSPTIRYMAVSSLQLFLQHVWLNILVLYGMTLSVSHVTYFVVHISCAYC